ncbi:hypothetical protein BU17DRAFT_68692 [Hysterangium stoloniferum]|nr:hypothetical protein BU17DRAFT_68692 [Hysterangium stoloniferum]
MFSRPVGEHHDISPNIHNLTQCQFCHSSQGEGVTLRRCSGCKIYMYCSVPCQMNAWKATHKKECTHIDLPSLAPQGSGQMVVAAMRAFAAKHATTITNVALEALDVDDDPERGFQEALVIRLKLNPEPTLVEKMFQVTDARVCSAGELDIRSQEVFDHLRVCVEDRRSSGGPFTGAKATHGVGVILYNTDFRLIDIFPVIFSAGDIHLPSLHGRGDVLGDWERALFRRLNGGILE